MKIELTQKEVDFLKQVLMSAPFTGNLNNLTEMLRVASDVLGKLEGEKNEQINSPKRGSNS